MGQVEYGDFYKFTASLGIALIVLAFLVPWELTQNQGNLTIEQATLSKFTPIAQKIIANRQQFIAYEDKAVPYLSVGLFVAGLTLLIIGTVKWIPRQVVTDRSYDLDVAAKEFQNMTTKEKKASIELEINETEGTGEPPPEAEVNEYLAVEKKILELISSARLDRYEVFPNVKIGGDRYDIVLRSRNLTHYTDKIVDIKYFRQALSFPRIRTALILFRSACTHYDEVLNRLSSHYIFIVYTRSTPDRQIVEIRARIAEFTQKEGFDVQPVFILIDDLNNATFQDLNVSI